MAHPLLHDARIDAAGEPEERRRVAQVVDPPAVSCRGPVESHDRAAVQLCAPIRREQQMSSHIRRSAIPAWTRTIGTPPRGPVRS